MEARKLPCVRLTPAATDAYDRSRIGGLPAMAGRFDWPHWQGRPLAFIAQLELAEIAAARALDWLPDHGRLLFFYDTEQDAWGFDPKDQGAWAVLWDSSEQAASLLEPPAGLPEYGRLQETRMTPAAVTSFPSPERLGVAVGVLSDDEWETIDERVRPPAPAHQVGGYPVPVQGDGMELECQLASNGVYVGGPEGYSTPQAHALEAGADDWILLLQVDSDEDAGILWGDSGMLYYWIRKQDAADRDFSKVWMVLQCC